MLTAQRLFVCLFLLFGGALMQVGQAQPTADLTAVSVGGGDLLTIGGLLQTDLYLNRSDGDGFRARSTRLRFGGQAKDLQYVVQTEFSSSNVLLDAFIRLPITEKLRLTTGLFKTPFSAEILTGRPNILLAERARAVNAIAPGRQVGATLSAPLASDRLTVTAGAFNGTPGLQPKKNDNLLYTGRVTGRLSVGEGQLKLGTNAAYKIDRDYAFAGRSNFTGSRLLYGADASLVLNRWLVEGEVDGARLSPDGADDASPFGFYVTAGADVIENHQVLVRFDQYDPDFPNRNAPTDQVGIGYNYEPSSLLRVLLNYQTPVDALSDGVLTARLQVALR